jgi:NitT/TauT family transport system substrate-binding protein
MKKSWKCVAAAIVLTSVLGLAGCGGQAGNGSGSAAKSASAQTETKTNMRVAYSPSLCEASTVVAYEKGFFKEEGINAEMINIQGASETEALGTDKVDGMQTLVSKIIQPIQNGLPVKLTAGLHTGCVRIVTRPDTGITDVKGLKGKKIGVSGLADTATVIAQRALHTDGIGVTPDNMEVEFVVVERNSLPQALKSGQVDAIAMTDPVGAIAMKEYGFTSVLDTASSPEFKDEYCCSAILTSKFVEEHPDLAKGYTRALMKGALYVSKHPDEVAQMLHDKNYVSGDVALNAELLKSYNYIPSVKGGHDAIVRATKQLGEIGIVNPTDAEALADGAFQYFDGLEDTPSL